MKKFSAILILGFAVSVFADASIFTGEWCVDGEDMKLEFIGKDSVVFSSDNDESVSGKGKFSYDDKLLIAELDNAGMKMKITYEYKKTATGVEVVTKSLAVNGDNIAANPEPIFLKRCVEQQISKKGNK